MIPKADGDSTSRSTVPQYALGCVQAVGFPSAWTWVEGWLPKSVFSCGNCLSSVEAWFSTALDIEEVLAGTGGDQLHVVVADVILSFDTEWTGPFWDCALGRLGLPDWFRKVYFSFHGQVRLRFKLAAGLGELWSRDGGIHQGCPLGMVLIVALLVLVVSSS